MEKREVQKIHKGAIWHQYFACAGRKDSTLSNILDEKIRYYKLYYPFLQKKQIMGKVYEELEIPHTFGVVDRNMLYKLYLKKRKTKITTIEKKTNARNIFKKPLFAIKQNTSQASTMKPRTDIRTRAAKYSKLISKSQKTVRFEDGIKIYYINQEAGRDSLSETTNMSAANIRTLNDDISESEASTLKNKFNSSGSSQSTITGQDRQADFLGQFYLIKRTSSDQNGSEFHDIHGMLTEDSSITNLDKTNNLRDMSTRKETFSTNRISFNTFIESSFQENVDLEKTAEKKESSEKSEIEKNTQNSPLMNKNSQFEPTQNGFPFHESGRPLVSNLNLLENISVSHYSSSPALVGKKKYKADRKSKSYLNNGKQMNKRSKDDYSEEKISNSDNNPSQLCSDTSIDDEIINSTLTVLNSAKFPLENSNGETSLNNKPGATLLDEKTLHFEPEVHSTPKHSKVFFVNRSHVTTPKITENESDGSIDQQIPEGQNIDKYDKEIDSEVSHIQDSDYVELLGIHSNKDKPLSYSTVFDQSDVSNKENSRENDCINVGPSNDKIDNLFFSSESEESSALWSSSLYAEEYSYRSHESINQPKSRHGTQNVSQIQNFKISRIAQRRDSDSSSMYSSLESLCDLSDSNDKENSLRLECVDTVKQITVLEAEGAKVTGDIRMKNENTSQESIPQFFNNINKVPANENHMEEQDIIEESEDIDNQVRSKTEIGSQEMDVSISNSIDSLEEGTDYNNNSLPKPLQEFVSDGHESSSNASVLGNSDNENSFRWYKSFDRKNVIKTKIESVNSKHSQAQKIMNVSYNSPPINGDELSTAYETDSETGKLKLTHYLPKIKTEFKQENIGSQPNSKEYISNEFVETNSKQHLNDFDYQDNNQLRTLFTDKNQYNEYQKRHDFSEEMEHSEADKSDESNNQYVLEDVYKQENEISETKNPLHIDTHFKCGSLMTDDNFKDSIILLKTEEYLKNDSTGKNESYIECFDKEINIKHSDEYPTNDKVYRELVKEEYALLRKSDSQPFCFEGAMSPASEHFLESRFTMTTEESLDFKTRSNCKEARELVQENKFGGSDVVHSKKTGVQSLKEEEKSVNHFSSVDKEDIIRLREYNDSKPINSLLSKKEHFEYLSHSCPVTFGCRDRKDTEIVEPTSHLFYSEGMGDFSCKIKDVKSLTINKHGIVNSNKNNPLQFSKLDKQKLDTNSESNKSIISPSDSSVLTNGLIIQNQTSGNNFESDNQEKKSSLSMIGNTDTSELINNSPIVIGNNISLNQIIPHEETRSSNKLENNSSICDFNLEDKSSSVNMIGNSDSITTAINRVEINKFAKKVSADKITNEEAKNHTAILRRDQATEKQKPGDEKNILPPKDESDENSSSSYLNLSPYTAKDRIFSKMEIQRAIRKKRALLVKNVAKDPCDMSSSSPDDRNSAKRKPPRKIIRKGITSSHIPTNSINKLYLSQDYSSEEHITDKRPERSLIESSSPLVRELTELKKSSHNKELEDEERSVSHRKQKTNFKSKLSEIFHTSPKQPTDKLPSLIAIRNKSNYLVNNVFSSQEKKLNTPSTKGVHDSNGSTLQNVLENDSEEFISSSPKIIWSKTTSMKRALQQSVDLDLNIMKKSGLSTANNSSKKENIQNEKSLNSGNLSEGDLENKQNCESNVRLHEACESMNLNIDDTVLNKSKTLEHEVQKGIIQGDIAGSIKGNRENEQVKSHVTTIIYDKNNLYGEDWQPLKLINENNKLRSHSIHNETDMNQKDFQSHIAKYSKVLKNHYEDKALSEKDNVSTNSSYVSSNIFSKSMDINDLRFLGSKSKSISRGKSNTLNKIKGTQNSDFSNLDETLKQREESSQAEKNPNKKNIHKENTNQQVTNSNDNLLKTTDSFQRFNDSISSLANPNTGEVGKGIDFSNQQMQHCKHFERRAEVLSPKPKRFKSTTIMWADKTQGTQRSSTSEECPNKEIIVRRAYFMGK